MLLPYKGFTQARRLLEDVTDEVMTMRFSTTIAVFTVGSTTFSLRLVEGQFPDYEQVIPRTQTHRLVIPRAELAAALRRVMVLTTERARGVRCDLQAGNVVLSVNTQTSARRVKKWRSTIRVPT